MATRVPTPEELCIDELERRITALSEQVKLKKEEVRSNFQQLHNLLLERENVLLNEMDDIVTQVGQEVEEKKQTLRGLYSARDSLERNLSQNKLQKLLEGNLRMIENEIGEEVTKDVSVCSMELEWKMKELEQSVLEVCKLVSLKETPVIRVDYSTKLCPMWSHDGTDSRMIIRPQQIAVDDTTHNIFVVDKNADRIQVFNGKGNHLYEISTHPEPLGIGLTDEYIFVSTQYNLVLKMEKSSNKFIKSVQTKNIVFGIDSMSNSEIYVCELSNQSVIVFDEDLKLLKRIKLKTTQVNSDTRTYSIKLYEGNMYVMFGDPLYPPPFHLQVFDLEGQLVRCLIKQSEIRCSWFFSIDQLGNIIVADWVVNQIKVFSKEGEVLHTITNDMPGDHEFIWPFGVALDKQNKIIVAHMIKTGNLQAF